MKVAHVAPFFWPVVGGWEEAIRNVSIELAQKDYEFTVLTCDEFHDRSRIGKSEEVVDGIRVKRFPVALHVSNFYRVWPAFAKRLAGFDVVHAHNFRHYHVDKCAAEKRRHGYKLVLRAGSPFHPKNWPLATVRWLYDAVLAKRTLDNVDALLAYHERERERFVEMGVPAEKMHVVPFGVHRDFFEGGDGAAFKKRFGLRDKVVLNVGRLHYYKMPETLIDAAPLFDRDTSVVFVGGGDKAYEERLRRRVMECGVKERVHFLGETRDRGFLRDAYAACDAFVLPSVYEPFGMVLLEAMAAGKPVVATPEDGGTALVKAQENGFLVEAGDVKGMARQVKYLLDYPEAARRMGMRGKEMARGYTWDKVAARVEAVYRGVSR